MATLVQDVWLGTEPRLRARRLAPYEEATVRVVFHPDLGQTLDDPDVGAFLEALGSRLDVVAFEPRGQGGSGGRFGPQSVDDLKGLVAAAPRRWPDGLPLVLVGHGLGASLALAVATEPDVRAVALLCPGADLPASLENLDLPARLGALRIPVLAIDPRDGGGVLSHEMRAALAALPEASLLAIPGDRRAALRAPWPDVVATWATFVAGAPK